MNADGVKYIALSPSESIKGLPLSVMWHQGTKNMYVTALLEILSGNIEALTRDL